MDAFRCTLGNQSFFLIVERKMIGDIIAGDDLGVTVFAAQQAFGLKLVEKDYAWCTDHLKKLAAEMCDKRIVAMLEGGYVMTSLARSVGAHLRSLADL